MYYKRFASTLMKIMMERYTNYFLYPGIVFLCYYIFTQRNKKMLLFKNFVALVSVLTCSFMACGAVFNKMKNARLYGVSESGYMYVYNALKQQYVIESYTCFLFYICSTFSIIMAIEFGGGPTLGTRRRRRKRNKLGYICSLILFLAFFSIHTSMFKEKQNARRYPYSIWYFVDQYVWQYIEKNI